MDHVFNPRPAAWLLGFALAFALPASAQQGSPEDRARVVAQVKAANAAVRSASTALKRSQNRLAAARRNLDAADKARLDAEQRLKESEAGAARGKLTREQVDADRALAQKATEAVAAVRTELSAVEAELAANQAKLAAASSAVEAASASAAAYFGDTPPG